MVHGTVVQESPQRRGRNRIIQRLGDKSWDSTKEVLGQCSLGTVLEQCSLGTVVGQCSLGISAVFEITESKAIGLVGTLNRDRSDTVGITN